MLQNLMRVNNVEGVFGERQIMYITDLKADIGYTFRGGKRPRSIEWVGHVFQP